MKRTCRDYQNQVQQFINHELKDADLKEFLEHMKTCKKCADELETYFIVDYSLRYLDQGTAHSYDIQKMLEERLKEEEHDLKLRRLFRIVVPISILILVMIAALLLLNEMAPEMVAPVYERIQLFVDELWRVK